MKCRMEQKIEGNCYGEKREEDEKYKKKREKNSNENYFFHVSGFERGLKSERGRWWVTLTWNFFEDLQCQDRKLR